MSSSLPTHLKNEAKLLYLGGHTPLEIARKLSIKPDTVSTWAFRGKWLNDKALIRQVSSDAVKAIVQTSLIQRGAHVRQLLAAEIQGEAELLAHTPPKSVNELGNTPRGQGRAAIAKTLSETASTVFDWSNDGGNSDFAPGDLSRLEAIEVQSIVKIQPDVSAD